MMKMQFREADSMDSRTGLGGLGSLRNQFMETEAFQVIYWPPGPRSSLAFTRPTPGPDGADVLRLLHRRWQREWGHFCGGKRGEGGGRGQGGRLRGGEHAAWLQSRGSREAQEEEEVTASSGQGTWVVVIAYYNMLNNVMANLRDFFSQYNTTSCSPWILNQLQCCSKTSIYLYLPDRV